MSPEASKWRLLAELGQSVWYDNVARPALDSGLLAKLIEDDHVTGGTSNPAIFAKAVSDSDLYDDDVRAAGEDVTPQALFERLAVVDIQNGRSARRVMGHLIVRERPPRAQQNGPRRAKPRLALI